jgi:sugar/nucleoside kinase (ribokinase family)
MKLTKQHIKQLIKEELRNMLLEQEDQLARAEALMPSLQAALKAVQIASTNPESPPEACEKAWRTAHMHALNLWKATAPSYVNNDKKNPVWPCGYVGGAEQG